MVIPDDLIRLLGLSMRGLARLLGIGILPTLVPITPAAAWLISLVTFRRGTTVLLRLLVTTIAPPGVVCPMIVLQAYSALMCATRAIVG